MPSLSAAITDSPAYHPKRNTAGLVPFKPGVSGNPGGRTKLETEIRKLAQSLSEEAMNRCGEIMRQKDDERAALIATGMILDRAFGKVKELPEDARKALIDVARLGPENLALLSAILRQAREPEATATDVAEPDQVAHNVETESVQKP